MATEANGPDLEASHHSNPDNGVNVDGDGEDKQVLTIEGQQSTMVCILASRPGFDCQRSPKKFRGNHCSCC